MSLNSLRVIQISEENGTKVIVDTGKWYGDGGYFNFLTMSWSTSLKYNLSWELGTEGEACIYFEDQLEYIMSSLQMTSHLSYVAAALKQLGLNRSSWS